MLLTKVKSHLTLAEHLSKGGEAWSWQANKFVDELATITAQSVAPYAKAEATGWVLGRVTRLTAWMLPRIRYWLTAESTDPKVSTWKRTKKIQKGIHRNSLPKLLSSALGATVGFLLRKAYVAPSALLS